MLNTTHKNKIIFLGLFIDIIITYSFEPGNKTFINIVPVFLIIRYVLQVLIVF
jgi:hypothetical protein